MASKLEIVLSVLSQGMEKFDSTGTHKEAQLILQLLYRLTTAQ